MKVFISWSGSQSKHIARALRDWLRDVIQNLDPWMSELDIEAGQPWASELWKGLEGSYFGVVCLTAENLQAPWLHYEAGALAKTVDRRVCPYLYKIEPSAVKGPLSQLQMKQADEQGTKELVQSINTVIKDFNEKGSPTNEKSLSLEQLNKAFIRCWPELEEKLSAIPLSTAKPPPQRNTDEMLEEILEISRNLAREAANAKEEQRRREFIASVGGEMKRKILEELAEREGTVSPKARSGFAKWATLWLEEPPPPFDTPQEGKPSSK